MSVFARLLARLHSVFSKETGDAVVLTLTISDAMVVNGALFGWDGTKVYLADSGTSYPPTLAPENTPTVQDIADAWAAAFSGESWYVAPVVAEGFADRYISLLNQWGPAIAIDTTVEFTAPTSVLATELKAFAHEIEAFHASRELAQAQINPATASGRWVDEWCERYFGTPRLEGEVDADYFQRTITSIVKGQSNNRALEEMLATVGVTDALIEDGYPSLPATRFRLTTGIADYSIYKNGLDLINKFRAAGTGLYNGPAGFSRPVLTESLTDDIAETVALLLTLTFVEPVDAQIPKYATGNRKYGVPGRKWGEAILLDDQVAITVRDADDQSILETQLVS